MHGKDTSRPLVVEGKRDCIWLGICRLLVMVAMG